MIIPLRIRVLWYNSDEDYYQEMYIKPDQYEAMIMYDQLYDVTGKSEHEEKFRKIKQAIKEKIP